MILGQPFVQFKVQIYLIIMINKNQMDESPDQESIQNARVEQVQPQTIFDSPIKKKKQEVNISIPQSSIGYRADIDGLRTISVIAVVGHHAWTGIFRGGFIGVDIFFVISGYLISKIIFKELRKQQSFSYSKFYSRRIRRIFPALIVMLIYSFILLCQCSNSEQLKEASRSFIAASLMVINLHMMYKQYIGDNTGSYVQVLWTLGIEEQFYLFWPLFVTKLWKLSMRKGLITIGIATFILFQLYLDNNWKEFYISFYFLPFWQMLVGCFVAYYQQKKIQKQQNSQQAMLTENAHGRPETLWERAKSIKGIISSIAAILIIYSIAKQDFIDRWVYWNLLAILSTAVFIHCEKGNRVAIFIGKISYSWYLLHLPLLRFCNFFTQNLFVKVLAGFILAILCTYGIQNKIRFNKSKYVIPGLVLAMGLLLILFITVYLFPEVWALQKTP